MSTLDDIFNSLSKRQTEYDIQSSDFAITTSDPLNGFVTVTMLQRNFRYENVILMGNQFVSKGTKGILLFVSKAKYPVFIPIYFGNESNIHNPGSVNMTTFRDRRMGEYPESANFINLREYVKKNGLSAGVHFRYRSGSPYDEQWGTPETISSITNMIKEYFSFTKGKNILILGDISKRTGGNFGAHRGRGHRTGRAIDMYSSNQLNIASNIRESNKQDLFDLLDIFFKNGALQVGWTAPEFIRGELIQRYGVTKIRFWGGHANHFHIGFIIEDGT